ncbi:MAG: bifunctional 4-hydroxy-2-oxoglutarate aldolase/2-dehydro-3-deoxy-phosphogluconate aldolase [Chthoniobacterales bacterium]
MTKRDLIQRLLDPGVIAIIRADSDKNVPEAVDALVRGGVNAVEMTLTTPNALRLISQLSKRFAGTAEIGVGTVLEVGMARAAIDAGAPFVVTPIINPEVIRYCNARDIPIIAGTCTPTEAYNAHRAGADFIKIFPIGLLGPAYIKAMLAPLPMLNIIPTAGVTLENAGDFVAAGSVAVGAGASLISPDDLAKANWENVSTRATAFVKAVREARAAT